MPLPLNVSCFSKVQIGFTFLVPAHPGSPGQRAVERVCVCVCVCRYYWLLARGVAVPQQSISQCAIAVFHYAARRRLKINFKAGLTNLTMLSEDTVQLTNDILWHTLHSAVSWFSVSPVTSQVLPIAQLLSCTHTGQYNITTPGPQSNPNQRVSENRTSNPFFNFGFLLGLAVLWLGHSVMKTQYFIYTPGFVDDIVCSHNGHIQIRLLADTFFPSHFPMFDGERNCLVFKRRQQIVRFAQPFVVSYRCRARTCASRRWRASSGPSTRRSSRTRCSACHG